MAFSRPYGDERNRSQSRYPLYQFRPVFLSIYREARKYQEAFPTPYTLHPTT
ncbi:MAG: hypothetical protein F6J93_12015 [Oscillatoria sp. SIO1A7]|nr:hypothetical protein [Oscillatoria sp. SIO1A7]